MAATDDQKASGRTMAEFNTVQTVNDFRTLDDGETLEGYLDGFHGAAAPDSSRSRSYWHGWRNGMVESGRRSPDQAYLALSEAFLDLVPRH